LGKRRVSRCDPAGSTHPEEGDHAVGEGGGAGSTVLLVPGRSAAAQEPGAEGMSEVPVYVVVEAPEPKPGAVPLSGSPDTVKTLPGLAVRIHGVADKALAGKRLEILVTPPQQPEDSADPEAARGVYDLSVKACNPGY
jgi:hypothetical protein